jgi:hypothetical protein
LNFPSLDGSNEASTGVPPVDREASEDGNQPRLRISVGRSMVVLASISVLLALASLAGQISRIYLEHPTLLGFVERFYVVGEVTVPTWFSVSLLLATSVALALTALAERSRGRGDSSRWWAGLAFLFLLLSIDDAAGVHEMVAKLLNRLEVGGEGFLMYPWVVVAVPFVLVVGGVYLRFLWKLPPRTRWLFILGAALFLGGAVGLEMVGANLEWNLRGAGGAMWPRDVRENPFSWQLLATAEELLEMLGIVVILYGILDYLRAQFGEIRLALAGGPDAGA